MHEIDPTAYVTAARARLEAERLWPRSWLFAAHQSQLAASGDWVATSVGREPIVLVRDGERVNAFFDVCRHRGARITSGAAGHCDRLRCRYHGWEYRLDGSLRAAPGATADQVREPIALAGVACEVRHGIVWIAMEPERAGLLDEWLGEVDALLSSSPCGRSELERLTRTEVPCNWKISSDVHNEGYHLATLHPELDGIVDSARVESTIHGRHTQFRIPLRLEGQERIKRQVYLFPNVQVNWTEGAEGVEIYRHWPHESDPERAWFEEIRLGPPGRATRAMPDRIEVVRYGERSLGPVMDADLAMLPRLQEGLRSRAAPRPRLHRLEAPIGHMHSQIDRMLADE